MERSEGGIVPASRACRVAVLLALSFVYLAPAQVIDQPAPPPPGRLIDIGGRRLICIALVKVVLRHRGGGSQTCRRASCCA